MPRPMEMSRDDWRSRWLVFPATWGALHRVARIRWEGKGDKIGGRGVTVCGRRGRLVMPGLFSRMGLPRCLQCCKGAGVEPGKGNPYNQGVDK